jgi:hypothetical protein
MPFAMLDRSILRRHALTAHAQGDLVRAQALYRTILSVSPDDAEAMHYLGAAHIALAQVAVALICMDRSVRLFPDNAVFHFNLALALRAGNREEEAKRHLLAAITGEPTLREAQYHLGQILLAEHSFAAASRAFAAARNLPDVRVVCEENLRYIQVFHESGGHESREDTTVAARPAAWSDPPLVSVVIPCVNYGQFVIDAVNSCLAQTYPNLEVVVVEGGSTDATTRGVVESLRHPRVRTVFRAPRRTVGDNRNFGIGVARGAFICCLDADDMLAPDYVEKAMFCLREFGYDVVGGGVRTFGAMEARRNFLRNPGIDDFLRTNQLSTAAVFRRAVWEMTGGFFDHDRANGFVHEDWNFWVRVAASGRRIMNINWEHLIHYRQHHFDRLTAKPTILPLDQQIAIIRANNADLLAR